VNNKIRISKGFWVWGRFDASSTKRIINDQQEINNNLRGPKFDVHITLSGPISSLDNSVKLKLKQISNLFSPIRLFSEGLDMKDEFFQSLFFTIKKNKDLLSLKMKIDDELALNTKNYFPHISLYYGDANKDIKMESMKNIKGLNEVILEKISLVDIDEKINSWKIVDTYSLFKNTP